MKISKLSDEALMEMISAGQWAAKTTKVSTDDVFERLSKFNDLFSDLTTRLDTAALVYRDPTTGAISWKDIGERLLVGRSPRRDESSNASVLQMDDEELSRTHCEIAHGGEGVYLVRDLESTNGLFINDSDEESVSGRRHGDSRRENEFYFCGSVIWLQRCRLKL